MMAPMAATLPDAAAIDNVVAYIRTLPDNPAPQTVNGNAGDGNGCTTPALPAMVRAGWARRPRTRRASRA